MEQQIKEAVKILKNGGIVVFPTDTAFGVGCRVDDEKAVKRLFEIRKRPETQAAPVLVDTVKMAKDYLESIPKDIIDKLIEPYWPGALTIILPCKVEKVPELVRGGGSTLGVRIPNHPVARSIIRGVSIPILGPSANFHGQKTPFRFKDLDPEFVKLVDFVVKGECTVREASTVIDCSVKQWKVLREGAVEISNFKFQISNARHSGKRSASRIRSWASPSIPRFSGSRDQDDKRNITLLIDTSSNEEIIVGLNINGKEYKMTKKIGEQKAQIVLPMIDEILKKNKLKLSDLTGIKVNTGPGSFTGLRVGVSVANALSFALGIPVNNKKIGEFTDPKYE
ncbi:MAG: L-threonylcarbamoyladenylate synthase [Candidatus Levybacteria bacterium]|nr:L-threonylcarbamoyladenylate synthase [Candidatus Levybacteria bacterium]